MSALTDLASSPTYRSTKGRVPIFRPLLNGEEFEITVQEAGFMLSDFAHDVATLSCSSSTITETDDFIDSTISFLYGQAPRTEMFCGYITNVKVTQAGKGNLSFDLALFGVTRSMQVGQPRYWSNKTIPSAIQGMCYQRGLGFYSHDQPFIWKALAQTEETDWRLAGNLIRRIGWSLFNRYGVVMCYDPNELFMNSGSYATLRSAQDRDFDFTEDRRLIEFNPAEVSDEVPENLGAKVAYFTDRGDVQITTQQGSFKNLRFVTQHTIRNADEATLYANAAAHRIEEWNQSAEARIWGDTDIYPGMCVDVITSDPRYYRDKYNGRWLVRAVSHKMDIQQFQTMLHLVRPFSTAPITQDPYASFWAKAGKARPTLSITEGKWLSSWSDARARSVL